MAQAKFAGDEQRQKQVMEQVAYHLDKERTTFATIRATVKKANRPISAQERNLILKKQQNSDFKY